VGQEQQAMVPLVQTQQAATFIDTYRTITARMKLQICFALKASQALDT
jgi:hypothetical protein